MRFNLYAPNISNDSGRTFLAPTERNSAEDAVRSFGTIAPFCWAEPVGQPVEANFFLTWEPRDGRKILDIVKAKHKLAEVTLAEGEAWMRYLVARGWVEHADVHNCTGEVVASLGIEGIEHHEFQTAIR